MVHKVWHLASSLRLVHRLLNDSSEASHAVVSFIEYRRPEHLIQSYILLFFICDSHFSTLLPSFVHDLVSENPLLLLYSILGWSYKSS